MKFVLTVLFSLFLFSGYSINEYQIKSNDCYGNNGDEKILSQYKQNDSTTIYLIRVQGKNGYFATGRDTSTWLVKFNKQFKIVSKVLVNYSYDHFKFQFDSVTHTIGFLQYDYTNLNYEERVVGFKIYSLTDFSLLLNTTLNDTIRSTSNTNVMINSNQFGGYVIRYTMRLQNPTYSTDSIRVFVVDDNLQIKINKAIPTSFYDSIYGLVNHDSIPDIRKHNLINQLYYYNNFLHTISYIYGRKNDPSSTEISAVIYTRLDSNLNIVYKKAVMYKNIPDYLLIYINDGLLYKIDNNRLIFVLGKASCCEAYIYLLDSSFNVLKSLIPNEDIADVFKGSRNFHFQQNDFIFFSSIGYNTYQSFVDCYDYNLNLKYRVKLDSLYHTNPNQYIGVEGYQFFPDLSYLVYVSYDSAYQLLKINKDGAVNWNLRMPVFFTIRNKKLLNGTYFPNTDFPSQYIDNNGGDYPFFEFETIAGRLRSMSNYQTYYNNGAGSGNQKDTTALVEYKINIGNGKIIDTSLISIIIGTSNSKLNKFLNVKKLPRDEYAVLGTSNQLCTGRGLDIFSGIASKNYNTIVSRVFLDINSNGMLDATEHYLSNMSIYVTKNNTSTESYFDQDGYIVNYVDTGKYEISVNHNYNFFNPLPASVIKNYTTFGNTDTLRFALQPVAVVNDLMIQLNNNGRGRPGFSGSYILNVLNNGTTIQSAAIKLKLSQGIDSISAYPSATVHDDTLYWTFMNLEPQQQQTAQVYFHYKPSPENNIGDTLISVAFVEPIINDTFPDNNTSVLNDILSGSYDPNDKSSDKTEYTSDDFAKKDYIKYTIRFENTGNDTAFSIIITDTLDANLDISTFTPLIGKYNYTSKITNGNAITFTFYPIRLPEHTTSALSYLIKPKGALTNGININNRASIKFDYNEPVITNNTQTSISLITTSLHNNPVSTKYKLYPNPAKNEIAVELVNPEMVNSILLMDMLGHTVKNVAITNNNKLIHLNVNDLSNGIYVLYLMYNNKEKEVIKFEIMR